jgi:hypothetical protein
VLTSVAAPGGADYFFVERFFIEETFLGRAIDARFFWQS